MSRRNKEVAIRDEDFDKYLVSDLEEIAGLKSGAGTRFLNWLIVNVCGVYEPNFRPSSEFPWLEGHRNVGLRVLRPLKRALARDPNRLMTIEDLCIYHNIIEQDTEHE